MFSRKHFYTDGIILLLLALGGGGLLFWSEAVSAAMAQAVTLCIQILLPSLFPFFVLSSILTASGIFQRAASILDQPVRQLFGISGSCTAALLLGMVGGYPVGAKTISALYSQGACTEKDALHTLRFCNNAGPAFFISAVGAGLLHNKNLGIFLYGIHLISALLIGLIFRKTNANVKSFPITHKKSDAEPLSTIFLHSVTGSFDAFLNVCAFVLLFAVLLSMLSQLPLLKSLPPLPHGLLCGVLELTSGTATLAAAGLSPRALLTTLSFLCGFGGLSVQLQTIRFMQDAALPCRDYIRFKLLHGCLAAFLTFLLYQ